MILLSTDFTNIVKALILHKTKEQREWYEIKFSVINASNSSSIQLFINYLTPIFSSVVLILIRVVNKWFALFYDWYDAQNSIRFYELLTLPNEAHNALRIHNVMPFAYKLKLKNKTSFLKIYSNKLFVRRIVENFRRIFSIGLKQWQK